MSTDSLECPVCFTAIEDAVITKCEHQFCKPCIVKLLSTPPQVVYDDYAAGETMCPVCRQKITVFNTLHNGTALMEKPTTIYGGVYIQAGTEGLASYHFSEEESYISYTAAPPYWRLDDGTAPPNRKPFLHCTYDPAIRTFRAIVDWSDVNFGGDAQWIYRIVFTDDLMATECGEVISYGPNGEKRKWHAYQQDLSYTRQIKESDI